MTGIKDLLEDLNPQLLNTINAEFEKVEGATPPEPTRVSAETASRNVSNTVSLGSTGGDALDDLFPRVELDILLRRTTVVADAKNEAWKTKKEALETLQSILEGNKRLKPSLGMGIVFFPYNAQDFV